MIKTYTLHEDDVGSTPYRRIYLLLRKNGWTRQAICAAIGLAGGMLSIILGGLLWAAIPFLALGSFASFLNTLDIIFFLLPLPLLALGACYLDLLEKTPPILPLRAEPLGLHRLRRLKPRRPHNN